MAARPSPYESPAAFRRALTDRLRSLAQPHGPWRLADLQRQFAYDRLLARLYMMDDDWIVKGSTALLARHIAVRHTVDVDVYRAVAMRPSTRFKDLVDLVTLVKHSSPTVVEQELALKSEARRRDLVLPQRFAVPDRPLWERGYAAEAARASRPIPPTLREALLIVCAYLDPLLRGTAQGMWHPGCGWR